jgi:16S rRNA pseudouridine516 synthase
MIELEALLRPQGFGSRAKCRALLRSGSVSVAGQRCDDSFARFNTMGLRFAVAGVAWLYRRFAYHRP